MRQSAALTKEQVANSADPGTDRDLSFPCPIPLGRTLGLLSANLCDSLDDAGCPLAAPVKDRLRFEALLVDLSATFVHVPADQVDARIEAALRQLVEFLDVDRGGLGGVVLGQESLRMTHTYHRRPAPAMPPMNLDDQLPWYAQAIRQGKVLRFARLPDDLPPEATRERAYCTQVGLKSHVMIPLQVLDAVGAIGFSSFRDFRPWPDDLIQRLRLVGEIFTGALARQRADAALLAREESLRQTRESLQALAAKLLHSQEDERRRIAREMHDDWTQRLAVLAIETTKLEKQLGLSPPGRSQIQDIRAGLVSLSEDVHALSRQLHPAILDDLGLAEALSSECASFSRREGIPVVYEPEPMPRMLSKEVALGIYRVAQEALRNVARHAAATEARVALSASNGQLVLSIRDNGQGFDPDSPQSKPGLGLSSMEERVRLIQGELVVASAPGHGAEVTVRVVLDKDRP